MSDSLYPRSPEIAAAPPWGWLAALIGWTLLVSFYHLDGGARFEPTDCWVAQTAREMAEAEDWIVPRFSGETRLQKSPGAYWAVMATAALRGTPVDEVATRIPNACAAVLLVLTIFWLARRMAGDRAAIFAGFAAASSMLVLWWSHRGASDLGLTALTTASLTCIWIAAEDTPPGRRRNLLWLAGYFFAGLAMLYKLPMPLVCVGLPAALYVLIQRRFAALGHPIHLLGLVVFCLPWVPWALAVVLNEPTALAKWRVEYFDRFTGDMPSVEGQRSLAFHFFYLIPLASLLFPFTLSIPAAITRGFRPAPGVRRDGMRFLLIWFFSLFIFFTASAGKESRYLLPALPPMLVLLGCELSVFFDPARQAASARMARLTAWTVWILVPAAIGGGLLGIDKWRIRDGQFAWGELWPPYLLALGLFGLGACMSASLYARGARNAAFAALVAGTWAFWLAGWPLLAPKAVSQQPFIDFAAQLRDELPVEMRPHLHQVAQQEPRIVWYSDVRYPRVVDQLELLRLQGGIRSATRERQIVGEAIIEKLRGDQPALFVADRVNYLALLREGEAHLRSARQEMPPIHLWLVSRTGAPKTHQVVFGNVPPPWPEPELPEPK